MGLASVVLLALSCLPFLSVFSCLGPLAGMLAIILGVVVKRDIKARGGLPEDWTRAHQAMILGIAGVALYTLTMAIGIMFGIGVSLLGEL